MNVLGFRTEPVKDWLLAAQRKSLEKQVSMGSCLPGSVSSGFCEDWVLDPMPFNVISDVRADIKSLLTSATWSFSLRVLISRPTRRSPRCSPFTVTVHASRVLVKISPASSSLQPPSVQQSGQTSTNMITRQDCSPTFREAD